MIGKKIFSIVTLIFKPIGVVLILCVGITLCIGIYYAYVRTKIILMIKNDPAVSDAEILFDKGMFINEFAIRVLFNGGGVLEIHEVNGKGKGSIHIYKIDDNIILIVNNDGKYIRHELELEFWSVIIGEQLESVMDIIKNYHAINKHIEDWTDLSRYRKHTDEYFYIVRNRVINENLYSHSIVFDEQEYFLLKYPVLIRWRSLAWSEWQEGMDFTYPNKLEIGENQE
jgi:hypothetical protein